MAKSYLREIKHPNDMKGKYMSKNEIIEKIELDFLQGCVAMVTSCSNRNYGNEAGSVLCTSSVVIRGQLRSFFFVVC